MIYICTDPLSRILPVPAGPPLSSASSPWRCSVPAPCFVPSEPALRPCPPHAPLSAPRVVSCTPAYKRNTKDSCIKFRWWTKPESKPAWVLSVKPRPKSQDSKGLGRNAEVQWPCMEEADEWMIIVKKTKSQSKAVRLWYGLHQCERLKTYQCVSFLEKPPTAMKTNAMPQNLISTAAISKLKDGYKKKAELAALSLQVC